MLTLLDIEKKMNCSLGPVGNMEVGEEEDINNF